MVSSKTWILVAIAVVLVGVMLSGCGGGDGGTVVTGKYGSVTGRVLDFTTSLPLGGVMITIGGKTALTGVDGYFTVVDIPRGSQTVYVTPNPDTNLVLPPGSQNPTVLVVADNTVVLPDSIFLIDDTDAPPDPPA